MPRAGHRADLKAHQSLVPVSYVRPLSLHPTARFTCFHFFCCCFQCHEVTDFLVVYRSSWPFFSKSCCLASNFLSMHWVSPCWLLWFILVKLWSRWFKTIYKDDLEFFPEFQSVNLVLRSISQIGRLIWYKISLMITFNTEEVFHRELLGLFLLGHVFLNLQC